MHKIICVTVALAVLGWSGSAWAVLQETTVTLTDNGKPLPEAKITLNRITDSEPAPEPKTEKTDESGKIVIVHDDKDKTSDSTIDIIVQTSEGKTLTRRLLVREFLTSETIDVAVPFETQHAGESSQAAEECADLTTLDDDQLKIMLGNPELRERIVKLIEETEETEEPETATETKKEKETVSRPGKEKKKAAQKKSKKQPTTTTSQRKGPGAAEVLGTGLSIGLGIAGSRSGRGGGHRGHMKGMD
jgi:hypothetical protein